MVTKKRGKPPPFSPTRKLRRRQLKNHNAAIGAKPISAALRDKKVREVAATFDAKTATGVESTLKNWRRANAHYNEGHVHVGADPRDDYVTLGAPAAKEDLRALPVSADPVAEKARAQAERRAAYAMKREQRVSKDERGMREDTAAAKDDKDDSAVLSAREGPIANVGPLFRQTERAAAGAVSGMRRRDAETEKLAWFAFEFAHPTEAAEIEKVSKRGEENARVETAGTPDDAFAIAAASFIQKNIRNAEGRARRRGELAGYWGLWRDYLRDYRRKAPEPHKRLSETQQPSLPQMPRIEHRYPAPLNVPVVVREILRGPNLPVPRARPANRWEEDGMPLTGGFGLFCIKPLEQVLREADEVGRWSEDPFGRARAENRARDDWWNMYLRHKPRSLLDL